MPTCCLQTTGDNLPRIPSQLRFNHYNINYTTRPCLRPQQSSTPHLRCSLTLRSAEMNDTLGPGLFPLHRCKILHLVRHAQGIHNVEAEKDQKAYLSPALFDAQLTQLGWQQVDNLRKHVHDCGLAKRIDLVITSPLLRTMQTAVGVFGGDGYVDGMIVPPLMVANAGNSDRSAYSSSNCPPFIAVEDCREHLGVRPCDKRRSISEYLHLFPAIDFSLIESDEDILWKAKVREPNEDVGARGMKFLNWLWSRKEKEIAIVTHSGFLFHTLKAYGNGFHPLMKEEICKQTSKIHITSFSDVSGCGICGGLMKFLSSRRAISTRFGVALWPLTEQTLNCRGTKTMCGLQQAYSCTQIVLSETQIGQALKISPEGFLAIYRKLKVTWSCVQNRGRSSS